MKKSLVLAMAMALGVTASAYAANPFSDVPAGHWAYDSVNKLVAAGVVDGYPDGTYGGDKLMTRYEMAQIVAKAMAKGADVDKLAAEFADELDTLGVRVANLEKKADNVKITGETRLRYWDYDGDTSNGSKTQLRTRVWVKGQVNEDWSATAMLENVQKIAGEKSYGGDETTKFQRAYVNGKLGGLAVQAGRYHFSDMNEAMIYDDRMDGVQVAYGKDVKLTAGYGKGSDAESANGENNAEDMYYAELTSTIGVVDAEVGFYKFDNVFGDDINDTVWTAGVAFPVVKDLKLNATYLRADYEGSDVELGQKVDIDDNGDGYIVGLKYKGAKASEAGSWGLWANYYDMEAGTYIAPTFEANIDEMDGFKGYGVGVDYTFAKNIVGQVKYYDLDGKEDTDDQKTLYAQVNFAF